MRPSSATSAATSCSAPAVATPARAAEPPAAAPDTIEAYEVDLDRIEGLFDVSPAEMLGDHPRLYSGIDEIIAEFDARPVRQPRVLVRLPPAELRADTQDRVRRAVRAYCEQRLEHTGRDIAAQRRDGLRALALGVVIFAIGFFLARAVSQSDIDADIRIFLADGVFLIFAWVGLWYPLDALIYYPMRQRRDRRLLKKLRISEILVSSANQEADTPRT